jgi:hypothetical protein
VGGEEVMRLRTSFLVVGSLGAQITEERLPEPGEARYGAGIFVQRSEDGDLLIRGPGGYDLGFISDLVVFPEERLAAAVLCNHVGHEPFQMGRRLLDAYVESRG